ncbi:uncharacterized protein LOC128673790 [Plodia interpunctella]|uniref:uncharacterized protein LOC128673790 n=1 Tax=Plodia interpunctella TaxID=58824 RepID=UPI002367F4FB|nr:uncharacterized protein LOC128673790 [Plodia interpunctella]
MASKVWSTFTAKKSNGSEVKLRIQDMPADKFEEVLIFLEDYYINNNVFYKIVGFSKNPEAVKESLDIMRQMLQGSPHSIVVCCEDKGDAVGEIVGVTVTSVITNKENLDDFLNLNFKTKEVAEIFAIYGELLKLYDVFKGKNIDRFADDRGLAVSIDYGVEVLKELLNVRRKLCKELNTPLSVIWALSNDVQRAAEAAGWETAFEVSREEVGKKTGVKITEEPVTYKIMIGKSL